MAKIQIKSEKLTPFGGIFSIMEQFDSTLPSVYIQLQIVFRLLILENIVEFCKLYN